MRLFSFFISILIFNTIVAQTLVDGNVVSLNTTFQPNTANDYISIYQRYISQLKNGKCAMFPSCSNYGMQLYSERNFLNATILLSDRLVRCSHDSNFYHTTYEYGYLSYIDTPFNDSKKFHNQIPPYTDILRSSKDSTLLFVNSLINSGDYIGALLEIRRAEFHNNPLRDDLYVKKLISLRGLGKLKEAVYEYDVLFPERIKNRTDVIFEMSKIYYLLDNYEDTINLLGTLNNPVTATSKQYNACVIEAMAYARLEKVDSALYILNNIQNFQDSVLYNYNICKIKELSSFKKKNTTLASCLSIIPGLGYMYARHKGSALTSFLVNSLLAYATYTSIKSQNYGVAGIMGFMSLSFYIGNINGAARSARRYNTMKTEKLISDIERANNIFNN